MAPRALKQQATSDSSLFPPGTLAVVSLVNPREKFWCAVLALSPAGLSVRGIEMACFDDFAALARSGSPVTATEVFFPMHRIERIETDISNGDIPSLAERFRASTGKSAHDLFERPPDAPGLQFHLPSALISQLKSRSTVDAGGAMEEREHGTVMNRAMANKPRPTGRREPQRIKFRARKAR